MANKGYKWQPGQSGNPAGRPVKNRALTAILENAGNKTIADGDKRVARKRVLARMLWQLSTDGKTTMPDGSVLILEPDDWVGLVKWIYSHIDGPAKSEIDVTTGGEPVTIEVVLHGENAREVADAASGTVAGGE